MILTRPRRVLRTLDREFWDFVDASDLRLQQCSECGAYRFPPAPVCSECLGVAAVWQSVRQRAVVRSWVTISRQYFHELPPPNTVVVAELEEGPMLVADFAGHEPELVLDETVVTLRFDPATFGDGGDGLIYRWQL